MSRRSLGRSGLNATAQSAEVHFSLFTHCDISKSTVSPYAHLWFGAANFTCIFTVQNKQRGRTRGNLILTCFYRPLSTQVCKNRTRRWREGGKKTRNNPKPNSSLNLLPVFSSPCVLMYILLGSQGGSSQEPTNLKGGWKA